MTDVEAALIRNEWGRIIALALSSQGYAQTDSEVVGLAFLRELEEQGVTLRRMTDIEESFHNDPAAMAHLARKAAAWDALPALIDSLYREDEDAPWLLSEFWVDGEPYVLVTAVHAAIAAALSHGG